MQRSSPVLDTAIERLGALRERLPTLRERLCTLRHDYEYRAAGGRVYYAVDWSELFQFLTGGAGEVDVGFQSKRSERDMLVRLALNHLFSTLSDTLYLLPPHASEMWSFVHSARQRHENLFEQAAQEIDKLPTSARRVLESLETGTEVIAEVELDAVIELVKGRFKELCDHVMTHRTLLDRGMLGRLRRLLSERKVSYEVEVLLETLGGSQADLEASNDAIDQVAAVIPFGRFQRASKWRDARALVQLRNVNRRAVLQDAYMVLVTRDQSLRDAASRLEHESWFEWPAVRTHFRHVETIYLDLALRGVSSCDEALRWLTGLEDRFHKLELSVQGLLKEVELPDAPTASFLTDVSAVLDEVKRVWHEHVNLRLSLAKANVPWQVDSAEPPSAAHGSDGSGASRSEIALIRGLWEFVKNDRYRQLARKSIDETWVELHDDAIRMLLWSAIGEKGGSLIAQALALRSEDGQATLQSMRGVHANFLCSLQFVSERYQKLLADLRLGDDDAPKRLRKIRDAFLAVVRVATTDRREPEGFLCMAFLLGVLNLWDEARILAERSLDMPGAKRVCEIEYFLAVAHRRLATVDKRPNIDEYAAAYEHIMKAINMTKEETGQDGSQDPRYLKERETILLEFRDATRGRPTSQLLDLWHSDVSDDLRIDVPNGVRPTNVNHAHRYAKFGLFSEHEAQQLDHMAALVAEYLARKDPPRPLCLAVFGAPGSGKSRLVKKLPEIVGGDELAKLAEINLTQVTSLDALAGTLKAAKAKAEAGNRVPFVFFDEFDSPRAGAPWGWLGWFLAPMQDGEFRCGARAVELTCAIYVFAGGTVSRFEQLGAAAPDVFALAKGPDFVSRLRGYLNIPGVNDDVERTARRKAVLDHERNEHRTKWREKLLTDELETALLHVGRYKYGARSISALLELLPHKEGPIGIDDIRGHPLLRMHVDRGPLDPKTIGGCIGVSTSDALAEESPAVWHATCEGMLRDGASLACGGRKAGEGLMRQLHTIMRSLPRPLEPAGQRWLVTTAVLGTGALPRDPRIELLEADPVLPDELPAKRDVHKTQRFAAALRLFRMRYRLELRCVTRFAIGGTLDRPGDAERWERFPGVVDELMLAIALGHPVYVSGALPGAAKWAGILLGLGRGWEPLPRGFERDWLKIPADRALLFRPSPLVDLPLTRAELIDFLRVHALGGPGWIDNGLDADDNRKLFKATDAADIARLVIQGLRARFDRIGRLAGTTRHPP